MARRTARKSRRKSRKSKRRGRRSRRRQRGGHVAATASPVEPEPEKVVEVPTEEGPPPQTGGKRKRKRKGKTAKNKKVANVN